MAKNVTKIHSLYDAVQFSKNFLSKPVADHNLFLHLTADILREMCLPTILRVEHGSNNFT